MNYKANRAKETYPLIRIWRFAITLTFIIKYSVQGYNQALQLNNEEKIVNPLPKSTRWVMYMSQIGSKGDKTMLT